MVIHALAAALISSVASLIGGVLLIVRYEFVRGHLEALTAFAAGVLVATAFLDLLPESEATLGGAAFAFTLAGFLAFYALECVIRSVHYHRHLGALENPSTALIVIGDTIHNLLDGAVIAAGFMLDTVTGIATAAAVAVHEVPQEIGDFAVMLRNGLRPRNVILVNLSSALAAVAGVGLTLLLGAQHPSVAAPLIAVTAGFFIYVAGADLIPDLQHGGSGAHAPWLLAGVAAVWALLPRM